MGAQSAYHALKLLTSSSKLSRHARVAIVHVGTRLNSMGMRWSAAAAKWPMEQTSHLENAYMSVLLEVHEG